MRVRPFVFAGALVLTAGAPLQARQSVSPPCALHSVMLQRDEVDVRYGLVLYPREYVKARKRLFPSSNLVLLGGCILVSDSPRKAGVEYCP